MQGETYLEGLGGAVVGEDASEERLVVSGVCKAVGTFRGVLGNVPLDGGHARPQQRRQAIPDEPGD